MGIRVLVNGAKGRMGIQVVQTVQAEQGLNLTGQTDLGDDLAEAIAEAKAQVVIDFTHPDSAYTNAETIINAGVHPVVGTTGFGEEEIEKLQAMSAERKLGGLIAPNFAIGAVLMMRFSAEAAKHLPHVEIIELHHDGKAEAPSGTAIKTAQMIAAARPNAPPAKVKEKELGPGARGTKNYPVPIHSVRLPGHVAHQETILGGLGETLRLRHDSISRECFMPGVMLAVRKVMDLDQLYYGLEHLL
ncbi:MAG: 4-hydroxy-tetrahydrodipicolinate reductase [SAR324 cluster bacterium]|nr:4-hydroxy-tetrahydrodipicolinate reductase [SAR324 cluster bacterium]MCZ6534074.1 4-hydroxy-tetrahydrodipicolinate reductase [SAR324 cluster bacterium]MCZ6557005.1 4-hydroxy-tetrahydrodipicolinate reductase [SAR324 cluster bacterium]MCZ6627630.1 4-hydroxy-tetrahydrodipicolinate reductase [SAR324 cluster bacterium]